MATGADLEFGGRDQASPGRERSSLRTHEPKRASAVIARLESPAKLDHLDAIGGAPDNGAAGAERRVRIEGGWDAQKVTGVRAILGCRLDLVCRTSLLVYPTDKHAYARLCRLLSIGKGRGGKGACILHWSDVEEWNEGLVGILVADRADATNDEALSRLARLALSVELHPPVRGRA